VKTHFVLLSLLMACMMLSGMVASAAEGENLLANGGFEDRVADPWTSYGGVTITAVDELRRAAIDEDVIEGDFCLYVEVLSKGGNFWDGGVQHGGHTFEAGKV